MARVVILGAGIAGMNAAIALRHLLGDRHEVWVVAQMNRFVWRPSLPWVAFGLRRPEQIMVPVRPALQRRGIRFVEARVLRVDPHRRHVITEAGAMAYDVLLIALGAQHDWDAVPGADRCGHVICRVDGARRIWEAVQRLERGTAVFGVTGTDGCPGPVYEAALLLDDFLRRRGMRPRVDICVVTAEPAPLHVVGPAPSRLMAAELRKRNIRCHPNAAIVGVEPHRVLLADGTALPSAFTLVMPPYRGSAATQASPELADARGFVRCDTALRHPHFPEIFAAGDGAALDAAKTGHHAWLQAKVAARNIAAFLSGKEATATFRPQFACNLSLGMAKGLIGFWQPAPPALGNVQVQLTYAGRPAHWMKVLLERYALWKIR